MISTAAPPLAPPVARATSILKKAANESRTLPLEEGGKDDDNTMEMTKVQGEDMEMTRGGRGGENSTTQFSQEIKSTEKAQPWNRTTVQGQDMELTKMGSKTIMGDTSVGGQVDHGIQVATGQRERSPQRTQPWNMTSVHGVDMEMTRAGARIGDRTSVNQGNMEMTMITQQATIERERSPQRTQPWNKTSVQGVDMEMTRAGAKNLGDQTSVNQGNMEMTKIAPQIKIQGISLIQEQDDMEMTQAGKESQANNISPYQEDAAVPQAEESGWETMHSPIISVSPLLSIQPSKTKSQGELLRENFPSPAASPSPEMTRMLSGMPGKPKSKAGVWDGDVTSFMPVGESTRAIKIRLPAAPSTISPACSPVAKPGGGKMEVGDLTSFAPGEEYESTRKMPSRLQRQDYESLGARPKNSLKSPSVSPLPPVTSKEVGNFSQDQVLILALIRWAT